MEKDKMTLIYVDRKTGLVLSGPKISDDYLAVWIPRQNPNPLGCSAVAFVLGLIVAVQWVSTC